MSTLLIDDCVYDLSTAYRNGARTARRGGNFRRNPHHDGSQAYIDWAAGFDNEEAGEHIRFGQDVLAARKPASFEWAHDPEVPRDTSGVVDEAWVHAAQLRLGITAPAEG